MAQYIPKKPLVAEIEKLRKDAWESFQKGNSNESQYYLRNGVVQDVLSLINTLEVKDPYEQCIQYDSIKAGIQAHAETYSFNIESMLFNQLTKEQQKLWRKEIEQAIISGGYCGFDLAKDLRYKENLEVKEVDYKPMDYDFERDAVNFCLDNNLNTTPYIAKTIAKHFFELGLKAQKGE